VTLHLKEMKVKHIIVKVPNEDHKHVLEKVGASDVIIPEKEMAVKVARSIISPNVLDYIPLSGEYTICEMASPTAFYGKTIGGLHLRAKYHIDVIAVKEVLSGEVRMMPSADYVIKDTDILVVMGKELDVKKIETKTT
jgi:trk system potassium uptake protein TrkA